MRLTQFRRLPARFQPRVDGRPLQVRWLVTDCEYNREHWPELVGRVLDRVPGYCVVEEQVG